MPSNKENRIKEINDLVRGNPALDNTDYKQRIKNLNTKVYQGWVIDHQPLKQPQVDTSNIEDDKIMKERELNTDNQPKGLNKSVREIKEMDPEIIGEALKNIRLNSADINSTTEKINEKLRKAIESVDDCIKKLNNSIENHNQFIPKQKSLGEKIGDFFNSVFKFFKDIFNTKENKSQILSSYKSVEKNNPLSDKNNNSNLTTKTAREMEARIRASSHPGKTQIIKNSQGEKIGYITKL